MIWARGSRIAYDIVAERRDLLPSVERIMNAGLDEDGTVGALDPVPARPRRPAIRNRDPRVAIAAFARRRRRTLEPPDVPLFADAGRRAGAVAPSPRAPLPTPRPSFVAALWRRSPRHAGDQVAPAVACTARRS